MTTYIVEYTIIVDRPEKRDASFRPVHKDSFVNQSTTCQTHGAAVKLYREMVRGEWDFSSEYVSKVRVIAKDGLASPRLVRKVVLRGRLDKASSTVVA